MKKDYFVDQIAQASASGVDVFSRGAMVLYFGEHTVDGLRVRDMGDWEGFVRELLGQGVPVAHVTLESAPEVGDINMVVESEVVEEPVKKSKKAK